MTRRTYALVAGGGTGGHLLPVLALARALAEGRRPGSVEIVSSTRGLSAELLAEAGMPVTLLPGRGFVRGFGTSALASNVIGLGSLLVAALRAWLLVSRRRPSVVVAIGGYASVAPALAAWIARVPVVLVNVDAVPGAANRLVGRFASASAVAFEGTPLPRSVVTGAPVRRELTEAAAKEALEPRDARAQLGLPADRFVVGIVGGSLGARRLNELALELARSWADRDDMAIYHVVGRRDHPWVGASVPTFPPGGLVYLEVAYETRMDLFYKCADVVVARSGANTVAELALMGAASILVPLPGAPGDHQRHNAEALARAGAAVVFGESDLTAPKVGRALQELIEEPERLSEMRSAAASLGRPDALEAVAALVESHARSDTR